MSQERTRFPITPQERHRTARSSDDVAAVPHEHLDQPDEQRPPDTPLPPTAATEPTDEDDTDQRG